MQRMIADLPRGFAVAVVCSERLAKISGGGYHATGGRFDRFFRNGIRF